MKSWLKAGVSLAVLMSAAPQGAVFAQSDDDDEIYIEEIIVTAQKRESTLLETPVAITAVGGPTIERAQARDIRDIETIIPSLQVNTFAAPSNTAFSIRGIGSSTFNFGIEPAVGVFVDGVYRSRNGASINDFLGLERVEVLRGPQSTLFGKNTTAGVINFVTSKPQLQEWGVEGEATYGNFDALILKGAITGPIVEDVLAIRLDANLNQRDGFVENINTGGDLNDRDRYGLRGQILWNPSDVVEVRLIADYSDISENCCAAGFLQYAPGAEGILTALGGTPAPEDPNERIVSVNDGVFTSLETYGFSGQIDVDFDSFALTSISAYRVLNENQLIDADFTNLNLAQPRTIDQGYDTFTQEIRFASTGAGVVDWQFGGYFFTQDLDTNNTTIFAPAARPALDALAGGGITGLETSLGLPAGTFFAPGQGQLRSLYNQSNETYSVFAQADWHVTDSLTISGGLRYVVDEKDVVSDIVINDPFAAVDLVQVGAAGIAAQLNTNLAPFGVMVSPAQLIDPQARAALAGQLAPFGVTEASIDPTNPDVNSALGLASLQLFPPAANVDADRSDDALTGNITVSYDVSDTTNIYANYSRGFKGGGFSLDPGASRVGQIDFDPETADAFELGLKTRLLDNRLQINTAVFRQEIDDFQQFIFVGSSFFPANAGIRTAGWEFEANWSLTDSITLNTGFLWLWENIFTQFENAPCPSNFEEFPQCELTVLPGSITPVPVQDLSGEQQAGFPDFSGFTSVDYNTEITDDLEFFARVEVAYNTEYFIVTSGDPVQFNEGFVPVGASFGFGAVDGSWQLQFWGRNIFQEEFFQSSFPNPIGFGTNAYPNDPRTYGATLRFRF